MNKLNILLLIVLLAFSVSNSKKLRAIFRCPEDEMYAETHDFDTKIEGAHGTETCIIHTRYFKACKVQSQNCVPDTCKSAQTKECSRQMVL